MYTHLYMVNIFLLTYKCILLQQIIIEKHFSFILILWKNTDFHRKQYR